MISGMCFHLGAQTFGQFMKKKFLTLMVPYYVFSIISIAIYQVVGNEVEPIVGGVRTFPDSRYVWNVVGKW